MPNVLSFGVIDDDCYFVLLKLAEGRKAMVLDYLGL